MMEKFYRVYGPQGPKKDETWENKCVDCWWCMKPRSVTVKSRCYVPIRSQHYIDGSFTTAQEVEDKMTQKWGYFHSWPCALAYCKVHFPNICFKVHIHARKNGFMGMLAPATDPRYTMSKFNPYISKKESQTYKDLIPDPKFGIYMRRVPPIEQCTVRFPDAPIVLEKTCDDITLTKDFPQCVQDSEQLIDQLSTIDTKSSNPNNTKNKNKSTKSTKSTKPTKHKIIPKEPRKKRTKKCNKEEEIVSLLKTDSSQPNLNDFF